MKQIAVRVDDDLLAAIEAARGEVPRERWMRAALLAFAGGPEVLPPVRRSRLPDGVAPQGRQPKATHPKPATVPIAQRAGVAPRVHHPRCVCPICKPPTKGGKR